MWIIRDSDVCVFRGGECCCGEWRTFFLRIQIFGAHRVSIFWNFKMSLETEKVGDFVGWAFFTYFFESFIGWACWGQFDLCGSL